MSNLYISPPLLVLLLALSSCKTSPTPTPKEPPLAPTESITLPQPLPKLTSPEKSLPEPSPELPTVVHCPIPDPPLISRTPDAILLSQPIVFEYNKAKIRPESFPVLDQVLDLLNCDHSISLSIEAHRAADPHQSVRAVEITQRRAQAIRDYLIRHGVDSSRLQAVGFGADRPLVPNDSPDNLAKNRRIEFRILKPQPTPNTH